MHKKQPRLLLAAAASGSGKTTVTCGILRALIRRGMGVSSFKCGPDYIDPMFHRESVGTAFSSNLDLFLGDENIAREQLAAHDAQLAVIEGVMGFYDGIAGISTDASSYAVAKATETPVVLVVNCRGMSFSIAAQVKGFLTLRADSNIAAVILNQLSPALYPDIKVLVERECGIQVAGYLPPLPNCSLESRHLGLVTAAEVSHLQERLEQLAAQTAQTVDLELLLRLADTAPPLEYTPRVLPKILGAPRIGVARDQAFCFYYADTLVLLETMGAELIPFSPLTDSALPEGIQGLLLGGGYPELYARELGENASMRRAVRMGIESGLPTIAECGGFLYLHRTLQGADGEVYPMADVFSGEGYRTEKLRRFGYVNLTARTDNLLCRKGEILSAHEFHYWDSTDPGEGFSAQKPLRKTGWDCGHTSATLYAGFPHFYLAGAPRAAARFLQAAADYAPAKIPKG